MADIGIALSMQHVHATGLASRVFGVHQTNLSQQGLLGGITWPSFEYFVRCRDSMRAVTDFSLQNLQCHTLMIGYLIKGNAYQEAYNLLGITIRKAFIAQLHRAPLGNLTGTEKTAHVQLWWMLYTPEKHRHMSSAHRRGAQSLLVDSQRSRSMYEQCLILDSSRRSRGHHGRHSFPHLVHGLH
jgi:hypothetical protein